MNTKNTKTIEASSEPNPQSGKAAAMVAVTEYEALKSMAQVFRVIECRLERWGKFGIEAGPKGKDCNFLNLVNLAKKARIKLDEAHIDLTN